MFAHSLTRGNTSAGASILSTATILLVTRIIRAWNQTGQKFAGEPDIVKTYLNTNPILLWCLIGATYFWVHQNLLYGFTGLPVWLSFAAATGLVLAAFTFKVAFTLEDAAELVTDFARLLLRLNFGGGEESLVARARAVFIGIGALSTVTILSLLVRRRISLYQSGTTTLFTLFTLLALTQSRPTNVPLFLLFNAQLRLLVPLLLPSKSNLNPNHHNAPTFVSSISPVEISTTILLLQHTAFFASGGSNAVSSVDLSSAYNGVASFDVLLVGVLTFVGNWAGAIWWSLAGGLVLLQVRERILEEKVLVEGEEVVVVEGGDGSGEGSGLFKGHVAVLTVFAAGSVLAVMAACTALRTHLFIWTVFSPKYLYCISWSMGQHLLVDVGLVGAVYWLGVWEVQRY